MGLSSMLNRDPGEYEGLGGRGAGGLGGRGGGQPPPGAAGQPGGWIYGMPQQRPIGALDWAEMGAGLGSDVMDWWQTREERVQAKEKEMREREELEQRRQRMSGAWNAAVAGGV